MSQIVTKGDGGSKFVQKFYTYFLTGPLLVFFFIRTYSKFLSLVILNFILKFILKFSAWKVHWEDGGWSKLQNILKRRWKWKGSRSGGCYWSKIGRKLLMTKCHQDVFFFNLKMSSANVFFYFRKFTFLLLL